MPFSGFVLGVLHSLQDACNIRHMHPVLIWRFCFFSLILPYTVRELVEVFPLRRPEMAGDNSAVILAVSWTETCIGVFLFSLRFLSNWKFVGRFRWDFAVASLTVVSVWSSFCS